MFSLFDTLDVLHCQGLWPSFKSLIQDAQNTRDVHPVPNDFVESPWRVIIGNINTCIMQNISKKPRKQCPSPNDTLQVSTTNYNHTKCSQSLLS